MPQRNAALKPAPMIMHPVKSSHIVAVGHNGHDMRVEYKGKRFYTFKGISADQFDAIKKAESVGKAIQATGITGDKWDPPKDGVGKEAKL